jgi:hypothetical protein
VFQQRRLNMLGVLGSCGGGDGLHRVGDLGRVVEANLAGRQRLSDSWINRTERLTGQATPGAEPLDRQRPLARLDLV